MQPPAPGGGAGGAVCVTLPIQLLWHHLDFGAPAAVSSCCARCSGSSPPTSPPPSARSSRRTPLLEPRQYRRHSWEAALRGRGVEAPERPRLGRLLLRRRGARRLSAERSPTRAAEEGRRGRWWCREYDRNRVCATRGLRRGSASPWVCGFAAPPRPALSSPPLSPRATRRARCRRPASASEPTCDDRPVGVRCGSAYRRLVGAWRGLRARQSGYDIDGSWTTGLPKDSRCRSASRSAPSCGDGDAREEVHRECARPSDAEADSGSKARAIARALSSFGAHIASAAPMQVGIAAGIHTLLMLAALFDELECATNGAHRCGRARARPRTRVASRWRSDRRPSSRATTSLRTLTWPSSSSRKREV